MTTARSLSKTRTTLLYRYIQFLSGASALIVLLSIFAFFDIGCQDNIPFDQPSNQSVRSGERLNQIYFISDKSGSPQLYRMREDGSGVSAVTSDANLPIYDASISADGRQLAFLAYDRIRSPAGLELYLASITGENAQLLVRRDASGGSFSPIHPVWFPDGNRIAFTREISPEVADQYHIFLINTNGTGETELTHSGPNLPEFVNDCTHDGRYLIATASVSVIDSAGSADVVPRVVFVDSGGAQVKRLGNLGYSYYQPVLSTSGKLIACIASQYSDDYPNLFVLDTNGLKQSNVTLKEHRFAGYQPVAWSSDDRQILCNANKYPYYQPRYGAIVKVIVGTGEVQDITPFNRDSTYSVAIGWMKVFR